MTPRLVLVLLGAVTLGSIVSQAAEPGDVVLNEIAWAGRFAAAEAEWIELHNTTSEPILLDGWRLESSNGAPSITLAGTLSAPAPGDPEAGYFLLERGSDEAVPGVAADQVYRGALTNAGETLFLYDREGTMIDTANRPQTPSLCPVSERLAWYAGSADPAHCSMERVDPLLPDLPTNWATHPSPIQTEPTLCGTPRRENWAYNLPPAAVWTVEPLSPAPLEPARFSAASSFDVNDTIEVYTWSFGDGAQSSGQTASHTFEREGVYNVSLVVEDSKGARTEAVRPIVVAPRSQPVADFSILPPPSETPPRAGTPLEFVDESSHPSGTLEAWSWAFGDGTTAEGPDAEHTYAEAGTYAVSLLVTDDRGSSVETVQSVSVRSHPPTAVFDAPEAPIKGEPALFDASPSTDCDGTVVRYEWDFDGNGTLDAVTEVPSVEHVYEESGSVRPSLVVEDADGDRSSPYRVDLDVNARPAAQFSTSCVEPAELEPVLVADLSSDEDGRIVAWSWSFGDGSLADGQTASHTYTDDGTYDITLTVTDDDGATASATRSIDVSNLAPVPRLTVGPSTEGDTGTSFRLDACESADLSPSGSIVHYAWDLNGDGTFERETTTSNLTHRFSDDGRFSVSVRVTDDDGASSDAPPVEVTVTNRPPTIRSIFWTPGNPVDGTEVSFEADFEDPDGTVKGWRWTFGAEGIATVEAPTLIPSDDGSIPIVLTVTDDDGATSAPHSTTLDVRNAPPVPLFEIRPIGNQLVQFDARSSYDPSPNGDIVHFAWDFGDGTSCPQVPDGCGGGPREAPVHRFPDAATYTVTLVVIDDDGGIARRIQVVSVY